MARSRQRGLTSIPTPTHIWPAAPAPADLVQPDLPEPEGYRRVRLLLVPEEVNAALKKIADLPKMRSLLQCYMSGMYVTGSMSGDSRNRKPNFERLLNVDEVWVMCFRNPHYEQWRLMGRFAAFNAFVGLAFFRRAFLDGDAKYQKTAEEFVAKWPSAEIPFFRGNTIEDYMSQPVRDPYAPSIV